MKNNIIIRSVVKPEDVEYVREIVTSTNFFHSYEIDVAVELIEETLNKGNESGYSFLFAEVDGKPVAYSCFGLIPCTKSSYDLYWIVVHHDFRGHGIGKKLLELTEQAAREIGGSGIYAETSSQPLYEPTRRFYISNNYIEEARLKDFYNLRDDKLVYSKRL
ncbi:MAG: GNAT family N-acetyltransferase [Bacteroidales bacterium]|nr:GNAT family N-acetyltransferase [Bacteroidales bacterium]